MVCYRRLLRRAQVTVAKVALQLVSAGGAEEVVLEGSLDALQGGARVFPSTKEISVQLASYKLDMPDGQLVASSPCKGAALMLEYIANPFNRPGVDAKVRRGG